MVVGRAILPAAAFRRLFGIGENPGARLSRLKPAAARIGRPTFDYLFSTSG
jgi:hypothetical protein